MAQPTDLAPYRPGQGVYARATAASAFVLVALFGCVRLFTVIRGARPGSFPVLGMAVPHAALWAGGVFIVAGFLVFLFTFGVDTGLKALDSKTHGLIDLLIDMESELAKVAWPGSEELVRSTTAVVVAVILLGLFLLAADWFIAFVMRSLGVLPA